LLQNMGGRLEILASILVGYAVLRLTKSGVLSSRAEMTLVSLLSVCWCLFPWDLSRGWFDYPLTIVISSMAVGAIMRRGPMLGLGVAVATAGVLLATRAFTGEHEWITAPSVYVLIAQAFAAILVALAIEKSEVRIPGLTWMGTHPLLIYVGHYLLFNFVSQLLFVDA
ncbi:MAG: hypothetical protein AAGG44_01720, partial [Planctomycetota bacterium]